MKNKSGKLYYSIAEVAEKFNLNPSTLRFWEKSFPQIAPRTAGRGVRQYREEDVHTIGVIYYLVKEKKMTISGAQQRLKDYREETIRNYEVVSHLKQIRQQLMAMKDELDGFRTSATQTSSKSDAK